MSSAVVSRRQSSTKPQKEPIFEWAEWKRDETQRGTQPPKSVPRESIHANVPQAWTIEQDTTNETDKSGNNNNKTTTEVTKKTSDCFVDPLSFLTSWLNNIFGLLRGFFQQRGW